jgi:CopG family transcriptional regulator, nickel-responsive regulator
MSEKAPKKKQYDRLSISLPMKLSDEFNKFVKEHQDMTRSKAISKAMNDFLIEQAKLRDMKGKKIIGSISYIEKAHVHAHPPAPDHIHKLSISHSHVISEQGKNPLSERHLLKDHIESSKKTHKHSTEILHDHPPNTQYYTPIEQIDFIKANAIQHAYTDIISSTMHIHAGPEKCMLIIAVHGDSSRITKLVEELGTLKTIQKIELSIMEIY